MSSKNENHEKATVQEAGAKGGKARAEKLSAQEREDIARRAAEVRWANRAPRATHEGELKIGDIAIPCAVLEDGTRVISQRGMSKALGRVVTGSGTSGTQKNKTQDGVAKLPSFLSANNLNPFISMDLAASLVKPIMYSPLHGGRTAYGFKAELVPEICEVWLKARDAGVLGVQQLPTAQTAYILIRGLAHTGIAALVDEATGFQDVRARNALAKILEAFIAKELRKWVHTFDTDFYKEMFRLRNIAYNETVKRPRYIGHLTNDLVYSRLAPGVLKELRSKNPADEKGYRKTKHHQWLTNEYGHPELKSHLKVVIALMKSSDTWDQFYGMLQRSVPKYIEMPLFDHAEQNAIESNDEVRE